MTVTDRAVDQAGIAAIYRLIAPHIRRTPVVQIDGTDLGLAPGGVLLKLEQLQHSGSFKARGAFANLLARQVPPCGVVAASGGNHGAAVAYAAMRLGIPAKIFVPTISSPAKIRRIRDYGADLVVVGDRYADALAASQTWAADSGALAVHAFDQPETLLGQGTIGLEIDEQGATLDTLLVAVGGGGLIGGIAAWYAGKVRVVGVEPELSPTLSKALAAGRPVDAEAGGIAADSLAPRSRGRACVSPCDTPCRACRARLRPADTRRSGSSVAHLADRCRTRRRGGLRRVVIRPLQAAAGRTRRSPGQRRQYDGRRLHALSRLTGTSA
ncbi:MAG: threonine dehydratase [Rhodospirillaceae bacterium]|nr:threonine dehydratase [Rhodospirillaceae bacterium]